MRSRRAKRRSHEASLVGCGVRARPCSFRRHSFLVAPSAKDLSDRSLRSKVRDRPRRRAEHRRWRHDRRRDLLDPRRRGRHFRLRHAVSFAIGGVVAGLAAYSYAALGKTFPSVGGAVTFLVRGYGEGVVSGSLSLFQYFSYIITIALYATGFAAYAATFIALPSKVWAVGVVLTFTAINFLGSPNHGPSRVRDRDHQGRDPRRFRRGGLHRAPRNGAARLSPTTWPGPLAIFTGAGVLFVGYEGFGLITNAAANMAEPEARVATRDLRQRRDRDHDLRARRQRRGDQRAAQCPQRTRRFRPRRRGQAVAGPSRLQADRDRGAALDRVRRERHSVRVNERRLSDRQERRSSTGV